MQRNARIIKATAVALTNPAPEFVSLVKAGANKTPFKAVKTEDNDGDDTMNVRVRQRSKATNFDPTLTHPLMGQSVKAEGMSIGRIDFIKGSTFPDELAVKSWLDDGGYTGYDVEVVDGGWQVANKTEEFEGAMKSVSNKDVIISIGKVKGTTEAEKSGDVTATAEPVADVTSVQPVAKSEDEVSELKKKFDGYYASYYSEDGSFSDAIQAGMYDGLPPGMWDLTQALYGAISSCVKTGNVEAIKKASADYADVIVTFVNALNALDAAEDATEAVKAEKAEKRERVIRAAAPDLEEATKAGKAKDGDGAGDDGEEVDDGKTPKAKEEPVATNQAGDLQPIELKQVDLAGPIAEAMKEVMTPFAEAMASLANTVSALAEKSAKAETIETPAQTRKGAGVDDTNVTPTTPAKKADTKFVDDLGRRGLLGF